MSGFDYDAASRRIADGFRQVAIDRSAAPASSGDGKGGFGDVLKGLIDDTDGLQKDADEAVQQMMTGEKQNLHEVMLTMAKADVSFRMMLEVRNKLVEAYQEVMRMQV